MTEGINVAATGGEIDIMPIVANLMGIDAPYALGKDLLNTNNGYAVLRNGSVITDDFMYLSDLGRAYDIETGAVLDAMVYKDKVEMLQKKLNISDIILQKDAFKVFSPTK